MTKRERYREIIVVLARHGIGVVDDELFKREAGDRARAEHLRRACEELGTMFIKLGQVLSTRTDLLPEVYRAELAKLQDEVLPPPEPVIADVIREDLGAPPDSIFAFSDQTPLASASIGQVHVAQLFDGREVVVKVRKPGVDELVQIDPEILTGLLDEWSPRFSALEEYDARGLVGEFSDTLRAELDYVREAANVMFFRDTFKSELGIKVPDVINEYSKNRVLTEERLKGRKASDVADLPKAAPSRDLAPVGRSGADHLRDSALDLAELASDLRRRLDRILGEIERGNLRVWTLIEDFDALLKRVGQVAARTNATILVAACIIGLAMVMPYYHPQG